MLLKECKNPYEFYIGGGEGLVRLYDVRYGKYVSEKRHPYMLPINSIEIHKDKVITADKK